MASLRAALLLFSGAMGCASASREPASPAADSPAAASAAGEAPAREDAKSAADRAPPPTASPGSDEESDPAASLSRAEADLDAALTGSRGFATPPLAPKRVPTPGKEETPTSEGDSCTTACRALASMRRSADRICDLAAGDAVVGRCEDARTRVEKAVARVRERCSSCAAAG